MKERNFDDMIAYFNRRVSEIDIAQDYKMELLGMVTALGYKHEKTAQHWIPCSEQLPPEENKTYWVCTDNGHQHECRWTNANPFWTNLTTDWHWNIFDIPQYTKVVAWMELPKPYEGGEQDG